MFQILLNMVAQSLKTLKEYKNELDVLNDLKNPHIEDQTRAFCLAIVFYLGVFETIIDGNTEYFIDQRGANILAVTQ